MSSFLDSTDPRLGITAAPAQMNDTTTRFAIRAVLDAIGMPVDKAVGAPSLGFPVRVLGVRNGDVANCILNPTLAEVGPLHLSRGEQSPHTGPMRRNVWRAGNLVLAGLSTSGQPLRLNVPDAAAIGVQQALEMMDQSDPFAWMTPFHYLWRRIRQNPHSQRFLGISEALFTMPPETGNLVRVGEGAVVDSANPLLPTLSSERALLSLMLQLTGMRTVYLPLGGGQIGLALSLLLVSPAAKVWMGLPDWPAAQVEKMGLASCLRMCPEVPDEPMDGVVVDMSRPLPDLVALARGISGASGALMGVAQSPDTQLEDQLQRHFACLCRFDLRDGGVVYVARKSTFSPAEARARLMLAASRIGALDALSGLFPAQWLLRKDGQKVAI